MRIGNWLLRTIAVALILAATPLLAEDRPWQVKAYGVFIDGGTTVRSHYDDHRSFTVDGDYGAGLYAAMEYRPIARIGIEVGNLLGAVGTTKAHYHRGDGWYDGDTNAIGFSALLLALNVHLTPGQRIDLSVSPIVGHFWFSEVDYDWWDDDSVAVAVGSELAWGGGIDMDIRVAESNWSIAVTAKYLDTKVQTYRRDVHSRSASSFDPFMVGVGFGYKF